MEMGWVFQVWGVEEWQVDLTCEERGEGVEVSGEIMFNGGGKGCGGTKVCTGVAVGLAEGAGVACGIMWWVGEDGAARMLAEGGVVTWMWGRVLDGRGWGPMVGE